MCVGSCQKRMGIEIPGRDIPPAGGRRCRAGVSLGSKKRARKKEGGGGGGGVKGRRDVREGERYLRIGMNGECMNGM